MKIEKLQTSFYTNWYKTGSDISEPYKISDYKLNQHEFIANQSNSISIEYDNPEKLADIILFSNTSYLSKMIHFISYIEIMNSSNNMISYRISYIEIILHNLLKNNNLSGCLILPNLLIDTACIIKINFNTDIVNLYFSKTRIAIMDIFKTESTIIKDIYETIVKYIPLSINISLYGKSYKTSTNIEQPSNIGFNHPKYIDHYKIRSNLSNFEFQLDDIHFLNDVRDIKFGFSYSEYMLNFVDILDELIIYDMSGQVLKKFTNADNIIQIYYNDLNHLGNVYQLKNTNVRTIITDIPRNGTKFKFKIKKILNKEINLFLSFRIMD